MLSAISFVVNGKQETVVTDPSRSLLEVLREDLDLTGTKRGCDGGECGACTVLLDGKAAMACLLPVSKAAGREVVTIEGLGTPEHLHPIQRAFLEAGAIQCGFCTPGMIMETKAFLDANPHPTREQVVKRFSRHLCRCTGYVKIVDAVLRVAQGIEGVEKAGGPIGKSVETVLAREKGTGRVKFAADLKMPDMLHAKVLWSPHHRARILAIDTQEASAIGGGVAAVLTAKDIPGKNTMRDGPKGSLPVLARGTVEFMGDAVAVVAATSESIAAQAVSRIKVDYEPLEPVFDPLAVPPENLDYSHTIARGDVGRGFAQAEVVVEGTYTTPAQEHAYMEPDASLSYVDEEGRVVTRAPIQRPHDAQRAIVALLGVAPNMVRVIPPPIGGSFGGKSVELCPLVTALLAYKLRRPVKLILSREECLLYTKKRQPSHMRYRLGATREGKLVALQAELIANSGAYPLGVATSMDFPKVIIYATGPYDIPHVRVEGRAVSTNTPKGTAMRGLGGITYCFALESQMDVLAEKLGMDPLELRLRNVVDVGSYSMGGEELQEGIGIRKTLLALKEHWQEMKGGAARLNEGGANIRRGVGLACYWKSCGGGSAPLDVFAELLEDGRIRLRTGCVEAGSGVLTTLTQVLMEQLGAPYGSIDIVAGDTALTTPGAATANRGTYAIGGATFRAAAELRSALLKAAAETLEETAENVRLEEGYAFAARDPDHRVSFSRLAALFKGKGMPLSYKGSLRPRYPTFGKEFGLSMATWFYAFGSQMAEVEVDLDSGAVRVLRVLSALDVGRVIHPLNLEGQVEGNIMQGLGFALKEGFMPGKSRSFREYRIPTTQDVPHITHLFIEDREPQGPYGAKGVSESAIIVTPPAIANAVADALGRRIYDLPVSPDRVLKAP